MPTTNTTEALSAIIHTVITPQMPWWLFGGAVGVAGIMSIILLYHWGKYAYRKNTKLRRVKAIYLIGVFTLVALLAIALFSYESSVNI